MWVPPFDSSESELVGFTSHPFYDQAELQAFLAICNGKPCGRILVVISHAYNQCHNELYGFFGFFESINEQEVANALFDSARTRLADRHCTVIRGPVNPSVTYQCGLLVDGFDMPPVFLMPYNPTYYSRLI
jgi:hypothetical protein